MIVTCGASSQDVFISKIYADLFMWTGISTLYLQILTGTNINFTSIHHVITFLFPGCSKFSTNAISSVGTKYSVNADNIAVSKNRLCKSTAQSFLIPCWASIPIHPLAFASTWSPPWSSHRPTWSSCRPTWSTRRPTWSSCQASPWLQLPHPGSSGGFPTWIAWSVISEPFDVESSYFGMTSCAGSPSFSLASSLAIMSALPAPQAAKTQQLAALTAGRVRVTLAGGGFGESVMWATIRPPSSKRGSWYSHCHQSPRLDEINYACGNHKLQLYQSINLNLE